MNSIEEMKKKLGVFADNPLSRNDVNFLLAALAEKEAEIIRLKEKLNEAMETIYRCTCQNDSG